MRKESLPKQRMLLLFLVAFLASCTSANRPAQGKRPALRNLDANGDLFRDSVFENKNLYVNRDTGLQIRFPMTWEVYPHFYQFPSAVKRTAAILRKSDRDVGINGEMVLFGNTKNRILWLRIITEETGMNLGSYHRIIRAVNRDGDFTNESRMEITLPSGQSAMLWKFTVPKDGRNYRFIEYQIRHNGFNSRLTFWTLEDLMPTQEAAIQGLLRNLRISSI